MHGKNRNRSGYLLIELMIAVATIATCSVMLAYLQVHISMLHKEAEQYLQAVNYAHAAFEGSAESSRNGFTVQKSMQKIKNDIPYSQVTVTVSWKTPRGVAKQIAIHGGQIEDEA